MYILDKREREFRDRMRGKYDPDAKWYGLMVHYGRERVVRERILDDFVNDGVREVILPELDHSSRRRNGRQRRADLLFPSYVFLKCHMNDTTYMTVASYNDVYSILGRTFRMPTIIDEEEMDHLKGVLQTYPFPTFGTRMNIGSEAIVTRGLMEGMQGRIVEINAEYVKLETTFSFFDDGAGVLVSVPKEDIRLEDFGRFDRLAHQS